MKLFLTKLIATIGCCLSILMVRATDKVVNIEEFAKYRRSNDATPMVRAAIAYCRQVNATKLIFPKATYRFKRDLAAEKYVFMSNNDEGLKRFVFDLTGIENLEIDGQGSRFVLTGFVSPFLLENSRNVTLRNFSVDYVRTFHSEARILSADNSGITVQFSKNFPYKLDHQTLVFTDSAGTVYPWSDLLEFDPVKKETAFMANDMWVGSNVPVKEIKPGTLKLLSPEIKGSAGNVMVFASAFRLVPAFNLSNSSNIRFSNIDIFHCGGMGIVAQNSRDLFLDDVRVMPAPGSGRIVSITADATHFSNCSGKIMIENCRFENQKDDATNIHGIYSKITKIISPYEIEVELIHKHQFGFEYLKPAVPIEFADAASIVSYANNVVKSAESVNKQFTRVLFKDPISSKTKLGDVIASTMGYPEVLIRNCVFRGNRARGLLLNSRGKTVVENNTFHVPGAAILFEGDASFWFEQSGVNGVIIRNNTFDNCNYGVWGNACIQVGSGIVKEERPISRYHKNISIEHNTFKIFDPRIINAYCVDGLTFKGNRVEKSEAYQTYFPRGKPFVIEDCSNVAVEGFDQKKPNIIVIYADDLGYGDLSCYGAKKISTPNIDALARQGLRFTNAHASSSTCTPSRFSMLTGKYAWRQQGTGIADGDAPLIISPSALTLPSMLRNAGYKTGVVGKWHLGLGGKGGPDWNSDLKPGPLEIGFDYSFIIPATADRVPCVFVENHRVVGLDAVDPIRVNYHSKVGNDPTGYENPGLLKIKADNQHNKTIVDSISRIGFMSGGNKARWIDEDIAGTLEAKALNFIDQNKAQPFFLYLATHDIHVPRAPNSKFLGKSQMGLRGDAILQLDWMVGKLVDHLKIAGLLEQTMIIFSSDNGPVLADGYYDNAVEKSAGHAPAGPYRGGKYGPYEGGTRVPFIVSWPAKVKPGISPSLISQVDLIASLATLTGEKLRKEDAPDSFDLLPALLGNTKVQRESLIGHAMNNKLSLIYKNWKYVEEGNELYDLSTDPAEMKNLSSSHTEVLRMMIGKLEELKQSKR